MMKTHFFLDRRSFLGLLCLAFSAGIAWATYAEGKIGWGIFFTVLSLFPLAFMLLCPCFYVLTEKGIKIYYFLFLSNEYCAWENVDAVTPCYHTARTTALSFLFYTFFIDGKFEGKKRFYKEGKIIRTRRARRLIEKYTGKKIEGFLVDDIKSDFKKHRREADRMKAHRARIKQARDARKEKRDAKN